MPVQLPPPGPATTDKVWVKLEGVLAEETDPPSTWMVGSMLPHAREVLDLAESAGKVTVYGSACYSPRGQRAVQRWLVSNGLSGPWVSHEQTPPAGVEVIDHWPL